MTIDVRRRELFFADDEDRYQLWALPSPLTLPPIRLPDRDVLAEAAAATPALDDMRTFVAFVGDGRRLTAKGELKLADGAELLRLLLGVEDAGERSRWPHPIGVRSTADLPAVHLLRRWAEAAGLVEVDGRWLRCGEAAALVADDPLEAWLATIVGLLDLGAASHLFLHGEFAPYWLDDVDELAALEWLLDLYVADRPVPLEELVGQAREEADALRVAGDACREAPDLDPHVAHPDPKVAELHDLILPGVVRQVIARLEQLGAVSVTGITTEPTRWGPVATGGAVALTPLGLWAVNRLVRERIPAPVIGELAGADAVTLLRACARVDPDHAVAEFAAWLAARPDAVPDLVLALRQLAPYEVPAAVLAIDLLGAEATAAMGRLRDHPRLAPYVAVWLGRHRADEWRPSGPAELAALVELLDARWSRDGRDAVVDEFAALGGPAVQLAVIEQLGHLEHPVAIDVLDALAYGGDEDGRVAMAARAALTTHPDMPALTPTGTHDAASRP